MPTRSSTQIRQDFIDFFVERASHGFVPSSPVVPLDDPTLLFANAGMNQFKPLFLGQTDFPAGHPFRDLKRAVNSQKCIRAGGKHNDLEDVGKDTYHHTFFEMLGNWSFGDYFKEESIQWGWELMTQVWGMDASRLYVSYFEGNKDAGLEPDREAYDIWRRYLPANRIIPGSMKDNFWEMGDTGPCGPCSEIHFDFRPDDQRRAVPGETLVNRGDPNVIEFWNHVFIQFNRTGPGPDGLRPLPARHVDTGMGLERLTRILQGKDSNYDTDVFQPLFEAIQRACRAPAYTGSLSEPRDIAYRVIADHARALTFAIVDGADPSNEGRGYVLRRILRRAVRYGRQVFSAPGAFVFELVPTIVQSMGQAFPELKKDPARVMDVVRGEEEAFGRTLGQGLVLFERAMVAGKRANQIGAEDAFRLHDTYGFPIDLTQQMAGERNMSVDTAGFERLMEEARIKARQGARADESGVSVLGAEALSALRKLNVKTTEDSDKYHGRRIRARIAAIWNGVNLDEHIQSGQTRATDRFAVILDKTCFYSESGGQMADAGRLAVTRERRSSVRDGGEGGEFAVDDVQHVAGYALHIGRMLKGEIRVGDDVELRLDLPRRKSIASNHTTTHLLNLALRDTLGEHVDQKGSLVAHDRLRFDFSHHHAMTGDDVQQVESNVRRHIEADLPVNAQVVPLATAKKISGVRAVFGEQYPDPVRVVAIGVSVEEFLADPGNMKWHSFSAEFCGGTHLAHTGEAEGFTIISEEAVAKGVRRVIGVTGEAARSAQAMAERLASRIAGAATLDEKHLAPEVALIAGDLDSASIPLVKRADLRTRLAPLQDRIKKSKKQAAGAERERAVAAGRTIADNEEGAIIVGQVPAGSDRAALLAALDAVRAKRTASAVLLLTGSAEDSKVTIGAAVPEALIQRGLKAGDWVRETASAVGGQGGGRPDAAQGGGTDPAKIPQAIAIAKAFAKSRLA